MQICSFRESVTKARGPPAPKLLSKTAGCTAGKIVGAPRRAVPQGPPLGEFAKTPVLLLRLRPVLPSPPCASSFLAMPRLTFSAVFVLSLMNARRTFGLGRGKRSSSRGRLERGHRRDAGGGGGAGNGERGRGQG